MKQVTTAKLAHIFLGQYKSMGLVVIFKLTEVKTYITYIIMHYGCSDNMWKMRYGMWYYITHCLVIVTVMKIWVTFIYFLRPHVFVHILPFTQFVAYYTGSADWRPELDCICLPFWQIASQNFKLYYIYHWSGGIIQTSFLLPSLGLNTVTSTVFKVTELRSHDIGDFVSCNMYRVEWWGFVSSLFRTEVELKLPSSCTIIHTFTQFLCLYNM